MAQLSYFPTPNVSPRSVYVHVPFCRHRCGYCNFSVVANRDYLVDRFLDAIESEIESVDGRFELDTLYLGGGTPSHLDPKDLRRLVSTLKSKFSLTPQAEFTAECNPCDLTPDKSQALAHVGVNRISLGVQSLQSSKLKLLERDHRKMEIENAVAQAKGFANSLSIDLIFATPGEALSDWQTELDDALQLDPDHISTYELTFEKGTTFWNRLLRGNLEVSDEDLRADMYLSAIESIEAAGLKQYETSSFAKPGHASRHNSVYWSGQPYFAFGPGASSFVNGERKTNHRSPVTYLKRIEAGESPVEYSEKLSNEDAAREQLAIGIRLVDGLDKAEFQQRTGFTIDELLEQKANHWQENHLVANNSKRFSLTIRGRLLADRIAAEIVGEV